MHRQEFYGELTPIERTRIGLDEVGFPRRLEREGKVTGLYRPSGGPIVGERWRLAV